MKSSKSNGKFNFTRLLRVVHRDLGFLMVGVCLVYGISGMFLNHMNGKDPAFKTVEAQVELPTGMDVEELTGYWRDHSELPALKRVMSVDEHHHRVMLEGGIGVYNRSTGFTEYEMHTKRQLIYWVNKLHYNKVKGWSIMGDIFAVSLIFFALSGLLMVKGRNGIKGRGKWYLILGVLIPVIYIIIS